MQILIMLLIGAIYSTGNFSIEVLSQTKVCVRETFPPQDSISFDYKINFDKLLDPTAQVQNRYPSSGQRNFIFF